MNIKKAIKYIADSDYRFLIGACHGKYAAMDDAEYLKKMFRAMTGSNLDLNNPKTFNEKLQWLKLYNRKPQYSQMVDKYEAKKYAADVIGEQYLIKTLGVWDKYEEIDFSALPDSFVLKCTHDSGGLAIIKNKKTVDFKSIRAKIERSMGRDYYSYGREWPYKNVARRIIAEEYMEEEDGSDLRDYKIHCFNGEPEIILVCSERFSDGGLQEDFYDKNWKLMDLRRPKHPNSKNDVKRPNELGEMLQLARILAKKEPFLRVDFYVINSKVYFGEITFFPASGFEKFEPASADEMLGEMIDLGRGDM